MKIRNKILFVLAVSLVAFSCNKDKSPLDRLNPYDPKNLNTDYDLYVEYEIVQESISADGLLQIGEDMYIKISAGNNGPDPAHVSEIGITKPDNAEYNFYPMGMNSQVLYDFTLEGDFIVKNYVEPKNVVFLNSGKKAPNGKEYTVRIKRTNNSTATTHKILVDLKDVRFEGYYHNHNTIIIPSN